MEGDDSDMMQETDERFDRPGRDTYVNDAPISTLCAYANTRTFRVNRSDNLMRYNTRNYSLAAFPQLHSNGLSTVYDADRVAGGSDT